MANTTAYKVFTNDLRSPARGGDPVWSGELPFQLPTWTVDEECAVGWNAGATPEDALCIAGLWPNGRPSRLYRVETPEPVFPRGDQLRARSWTIAEELPVADAVRNLSRKWFGALADDMATEQLAWRGALGRPLHDPTFIRKSLAAALYARGLPWTLRRFDDAMATSDAWAAWGSMDAWDAWVGRDAWATSDAWGRLGHAGAWSAWSPSEAWGAWSASAGRDVRAGMDAWAALNHRFAVAKQWIDQPVDKYTVGIRDAYAFGLAIALPTGPAELGWAIEEIR